MTQYHGCWCPGDVRSQDISSHDIDYIEYVPVGPSLIWGSVLSTCVKSMWSNDIKCKYMFMFPLKNLALKGLKLLSHCTQHNTAFATWQQIGMQGAAFCWSCAFKSSDTCFYLGGDPLNQQSHWQNSSLPQLALSVSGKLESWPNAASLTGFLLAEFCDRTFWPLVHQGHIKFTSIYIEIVLKFGNVQDFQNFNRTMSWNLGK